MGRRQRRSEDMEELAAMFRVRDEARAEAVRSEEEVLIDLFCLDRALQDAHQPDVFDAEFQMRDIREEALRRKAQREEDARRLAMRMEFIRLLDERAAGPGRQSVWRRMRGRLRVTGAVRRTAVVVGFLLLRSTAASVLGVGCLLVAGGEVLSAGVFAVVFLCLPVRRVAGLRADEGPRAAFRRGVSRLRSDADRHTAQK